LFEPSETEPADASGEPVAERRCGNDHLVTAGALYCGVCGVAVEQASSTPSLEPPPPDEQADVAPADVPPSTARSSRRALVALSATAAVAVVFLVLLLVAKATGSTTPTAEPSIASSTAPSAVTSGPIPQSDAFKCVSLAIGALSVWVGLGADPGNPPWLANSQYWDGVYHYTGPDAASVGVINDALTITQTYYNETRQMVASGSDTTLQGLDNAFLDRGTTDCAGLGLSR